MTLSRRSALLGTLFGAGGVGLRALATGLPISFFLNPRKAMAGGATCPVAAQAQYVIFSTSGLGDPLNAGAPGTYGKNGPPPTMTYNKNTASSGAGLDMTPTPVTLGSQTWSAAFPWSTLPQAVLNQAAFFHMSTNTPIHPQEPLVLELGPGSGEMLPSILAKAVAPTLKTVQPQPVCVGAQTPSEALIYSGAPQPIIPPTSLQDTLTNPTKGGLQQLTNLQKLRDSTMTDIYNIYYRSGTPTQKAYITNLANTQTEVRQLSQSLLGMLSNLPTDAVQAQIMAALILIQMNVSPVISIHIPFGGDNHSDADLTTEATETNTGVGYIAYLFQQIKTLPTALQSQISFMTLNVFGRTLGLNAPNPGNGRAHNANHHVGVCIGPPFKPGVYGGVAPITNDEMPQGDFGATGISPTSGASIPVADGGFSPGGIAMEDTMSSYGMTAVAAVGGCPNVVLTNPMGTATVISAALKNAP